MSPSNEIVGNAFKSLSFAYIGIGIISIAINLLMLTGPLFMLQVYDRVLASGSVPTLVVIGSLAACLYVFYGVLEGLRNRLLVRIGHRVDAQLSNLTYDLSTRLPLLLGPKASNLRPLQDLDAIRSFLSGSGPAAFFDAPWLPLYLGVVFLFHPILGFVALGGGLMICIFIGLREVLSRKPSEEFAKENRLRTNFIENSRSNAEVIRAMGMMSVFKDSWAHSNSVYLSKKRNTSDTTGTFGTIIKSFRFLLQSAVLGVGAWLAIKQEVSPGIMIAASIMTSRALAPIEQAVAQWPTFVSARQSKTRLQSLFEEHLVPEEIFELPKPSKTVSIEQLSCGPAGLKQIVVKQINLELHAGDGLGVIGSSGSGKSTLARAIVGVTPALRGSIRFDGSELDQWDNHRIGEFIGYLPQGNQLFDGTISQNISRFEKDADPGDVIEAATYTDIHDLVAALPNGYNTIIGQSGYALSAGQQQRIALARAIYKKPFLIVLDEPNSNLDAEGEAALTSTIKAMRDHGSIVIVNAHRPSAIAAVDKILIIKDGCQAAFGPKDVVLQRALAPVSKQRVS